MLPGGAMSRLYIANANRHDSGNYTCALAEVAQTTVLVHVLIGKLKQIDKIQKQINKFVCFNSKRNNRKQTTK